jgi:sodium transport system permease protein
MLTMPLIFLTLAPGVELNPFYSMVPVTGVALLLQRLMGEGIDRASLLYFVPVLAPMIIYSWLALRWAIGQFNREEVLFREAERLDVGLWLRKLLRDKEALPSAGEAFFCFGLIVALRWLSMSVGTGLPLLVRTGVAQLAFVATPPLFMVILLTTKPARGLSLRAPPLWALLVAVVLGALVVLPLGELTAYVGRQFPALHELLRVNNPLLRELEALAKGSAWSRLAVFVVLALLPAVCEEVAFRGFILTGLRRSFRPWTSILLSAFLFSLYQMNVFQFLPHFILGIVLGLLAVRANSVLPSVLFHLVYNSLLIGLVLTFGRQGGDPGEASAWQVALAAGCALAAAGVLVVLGRSGNRTAEGT